MSDQPETEQPTPTARTRVVHVHREPDFDLYIGRSMPRFPELRATGWGNPFRPAPGDPDAGRAIARYRAWLMERPQLLARLPELRGKTLGCWCAPAGGLLGDLEGRICHGQVLAALADALADEGDAADGDERHGRNGDNVS
jgi:hypothetical protein